MYTFNKATFKVQILNSTSEIQQNQLVYYKDTRQLVFEVDNNQKIVIPTERHTHSIYEISDLSIDTQTLDTSPLLSYDITQQKYINVPKLQTVYINDTIVLPTSLSYMYSYSSKKITNLLDDKLSLYDTDLSSSDKLIFRNKLDLGEVSTYNVGNLLSNVAIGYHTHNKYYITGIGNSFDKNVGIGVNDVAIGNHNHSLFSGILNISSSTTNGMLVYNGENWIVDDLFDTELITSYSLNSEFSNIVDVNGAITYNSSEQQSIRNNLGLGNSSYRSTGTLITDIASGYHIHSLNDVSGLGGIITRNIGTTTLDVAAGYHVHSISDVNTLGNCVTRNIGTTTLDVAAGYHTHVLNNIIGITTSNIINNNLLVYNNGNWINYNIVDNTIASSSSNIDSILSFKLGLDSTLDSTIQLQYRQKFGISEVATYNLGLGSSNLLAPALHVHDFNSYVGVDTNTLNTDYIMMYNHFSWSNSSYINDDTISNISIYSSTKLTDVLSRMLSVNSTNLSNNDKSTLRNNLGINSCALLNIGTLSTEVSSGDHSHLIDELTNVSISNLVVNNIFGFDGTNWTNKTADIDTSSKISSGFLKCVTASNTFSTNDQASIRTNIGLGDVAVKNTGTLSTQVAAGNHNHLLHNLSNVSISNATNNQFLAYDTASTKWINFTYVPPTEINNNATVSTMTWSSSNIQMKLDSKLLISDTIVLTTLQKNNAKFSLGLGDVAVKNTGTLSTQVAAGNHNHLLSTLSDISISNATNNQFLAYDTASTNWVNFTYVPPTEIDNNTTVSTMTWSSSNIQTKLDERLSVSSTMSLTTLQQSNTRYNIRLGDSSVKNVGTTSNDVAVGNHNHNLSTLYDISISSIISNDVLVYDTSQLVNNKIIIDSSTSSITTWSSTKINTILNSMLSYDELTIMVDTNNGIAKLDSQSKINVSQLPSISVNHVYTISNLTTSSVLNILNGNDIGIGDLFVDNVNTKTYIVNTNITQPIVINPNDSRFNEILVSGQLKSLKLGTSTVSVIGNVNLLNSKIELNINNISNNRQLVASRNLDDITDPTNSRLLLGITDDFAVNTFGTTANNIASGMHLHTIDNVSTISNLSSSQVLMYNGTKWCNSNLSIPDAFTIDNNRTDKSYTSENINNLLSYKADSASLLVPLVNSKINPSLFPPLAIQSITKTDDLNNITPPFQSGDIAIVTSALYNSPYVYSSYSLDYNINNWKKIAVSPKLKSVNSKTGTIILTNSDFTGINGLNNIVNSLQLIASNNLSEITDIVTTRNTLELNDNIVTTTFGTTDITVSRGNHIHSLDNLQDISITNIVNGNILSWDGSKWINIYTSNEFFDGTISINKAWSSSYINSLLLTKSNVTNINTNNGIVSLNSTITSKGINVIDTSKLPAISINDIFDYGTNQTNFNNALTNSSVQNGDFGIITINGIRRTFVCKPNSTNTGLEWLELKASGFITSVNGKVGEVTITSSDIGLTNVVNSLQLIASNNLSELPNKVTARSNLGLTEAIVTTTFGTSAGKIAEGNHTHPSWLNDTLAINSTSTLASTNYYSINKLNEQLLNSNKLGAANGIANFGSTLKLDLQNKFNNITIIPSVSYSHMALYNGTDIIFGNIKLDDISGVFTPNSSSNGTIYPGNTYTNTLRFGGEL